MRGRHSDRIKAFVAKRDNLGADDLVGLSLAPTGTGQLAYHMMVNAMGAQLGTSNELRQSCWK